MLAARPFATDVGPGSHAAIVRCVWGRCRWQVLPADDNAASGRRIGPGLSKLKPEISNTSDSHSKIPLAHVGVHSFIVHANQSFVDFEAFLSP